MFIEVKTFLFPIILVAASIPDRHTSSIPWVAGLVDSNMFLMAQGAGHLHLHRVAHLLWEWDTHLAGNWVADLVGNWVAHLPGHLV